MICVLLGRRDIIFENYLPIKGIEKVRFYTSLCQES
jgi:hypothetical protein